MCFSLEGRRLPLRCPSTVACRGLNISQCFSLRFRFAATLHNIPFVGVLFIRGPSYMQLLCSIPQNPVLIVVDAPGSVPSRDVLDSGVWGLGSWFMAESGVQVQKPAADFRSTLTTRVS